MQLCHGRALYRRRAPYALFRRLRIARAPAPLNTSFSPSIRARHFALPVVDDAFYRASFESRQPLRGYASRPF